MRRFVSFASSRPAIAHSRSFLHGVRRGERYRFLASCCVIVEPPWRTAAAATSRRRRSNGRGSCPSSPFRGGDGAADPADPFVGLLARERQGRPEPDGG